MWKKIFVVLFLVAVFGSLSSATPQSGHYLIVGMNEGNNALGGMMLVNDTWKKDGGMFSSDDYIVQPDRRESNVVCATGTNSCTSETGWILVVEKDGFNNDNEWAAYKAFSGKMTDFRGKLTDLTGPVDFGTRKREELYSNCDEKPCAVVNKDFDIVDNTWGGWPPDPVKNAYQDKSWSTRRDIEAGDKYFAPEDPIIVGRAAAEDGGTGVKMFHLCNSETEGKLVYTKPSVGNGLNEKEGNTAGETNPYECTISRYSGSQWLLQGECGDGTSNDGDSQIDSDPNCESSMDNEKEYTGLTDETAMAPFIENNELKLYHISTDVTTSTGERAEGVGGISDPDRDNHPEVLYRSGHELKIWDETGNTRTIVDISDLPGDYGLKEVGPLYSPSEGEYWAFFKDYSEGGKIKYYNSYSGEINVFNDCGYFSMSPSFKDFTGDGDKNILTRMNGPAIKISGRVNCQTLSPYREDGSQFAYPGGMGDIGNDGDMEIAYSLDGNVAYADGDTYTTTGESGRPGPIADVDDDGNKEIIYLSDDSIRQYDVQTATHSTLASIADSTQSDDEPGVQDIGGIWFRKTQSCDGPIVGIREYEDSDPSTGIIVTEKEKTVFMQPDPLGEYQDIETGCRFNEYKPPSDAPTGEPVQFECYDDAETNNYFIDEEVKGDYCNSLINQISTEDWDAHKTVSSPVVSGEVQVIPAVEYFAPTSIVPLTATDPEGAAQYINSSGWDTRKIQNLHAAEKKYGSTPYHDKETWADLNMTNLSDGYEPGDYINSWMVSNGSADYSDNIADPKFPGGFAGKCLEGQQWQTSQQGWTCSGTMAWTQEVYFPDIHTGYSSDTVSFFVMPYNFNETAVGIRNRMSYAEAAGQSDIIPDSSRIQKLNAACWVGDPGDKPGFDSMNKGKTWFSTEITGLESLGPTKPVPVNGSLSELGSSQTYTCEWEYTDTEGETFGSRGSLEKLESDSFCGALKDRGLMSGSCPFRGEVNQGTLEEKTNEWIGENGNFASYGDALSSGLTS